MTSVIACAPTSISNSGILCIHSFAISRPDMPEVCQKFPYPPIRGRRECRAPDAPAAACAMIVVERTRVSQVTPESPGIPRAMVLTVSFALSPVTGLVCHRHRRSCLRQLDTSVGVSGPHDFAVRFSAVRQERIRVHRIPPRVRDDRDTPLCGTERGELVEMICPTGKAEYFCKGGWTQKSLSSPSGKSVVWAGLRNCGRWAISRRIITILASLSSAKCGVHTCQSHRQGAANGLPRNESRRAGLRSARRLPERRA
jgi:hypothetical protein